MARLRGGLIGFGFIGERGHLPAYLAPRSTDDRGFEIVAIADGCEARREAARRALPGARIYEDARALIAGEDGRLDFVDIATPPCDHASIARAAFAAGLHVICEKPLATTAHDGAAMLAAAEKARRVLFPCHNYKHAPVVRKVRELLDGDRIGPVQLVTLDTFRTTHARGVPEWQPDWRRTRRLSGGGIAMDHGSHSFYLMFDWLRAYPSSITAKMSHLGAFDTEDNFACTLTFPTGVATAQLTWNAGMRKVIYTLHGSRGAVKIEDDEIEVATRGGGVERVSVASHWMDASHVTWFASLQDDFARAIGDGVWVGREAQEALMCIRVIETAYASARSGCRELALGAEPHAAAAGR